MIKPTNNALKLSQHMLLGLTFCVSSMSHAKISHKIHPTSNLTCASAYQQQNYTEALSLCEAQAATGDESAHTMLGLMAHRGLGTPKNDRKAFEHFEFAAGRGNVVAQFHLGKLLATGALGEPDEHLAFKWFEKAANQQYAPAEFLVAICYRNGLGVAANLNDAEYWFNQARSHGLGSAAKSLMPSTKSKTTVSNAHEQYLQGKAYLTGDGVSQNDALALEHFEQAAQQNHPDAQGYLAWMMALGLGGQVNLPEAIYWFKASSAIHQSGKAVPHYSLDGLPKRAIPTTPEKQYSVGRSTLESAMSDAETQTGLALLHLAAENQYAPAQLYLSELYLHGRYVEQNSEIAFSYAQKAALLGSPEAQYALGWHYANGTGVERNLAKAEECFDKAENIGHPQARASQDFVQQQLAMQTIAKAPVKAPLKVVEKAPVNEPVIASEKAPVQMEAVVAVHEAKPKDHKLNELASIYHRKRAAAKIKKQQKQEEKARLAEQTAPMTRKQVASVKGVMHSLTTVYNEKVSSFKFKRRQSKEERSTGAETAEMLAKPSQSATPMTTESATLTTTVSS